MIDLERQVRERAYQIWEQEGRVHGRDEQHWHRAKLELTSVQEPAAVIEAAGIAAEPVKKGRRTAKAKAADPVPVTPPAAPRRRRAQAPLQ
jgi:Protein of unknown function (DUF2934)